MRIRISKMVLLLLCFTFICFIPQLKPSFVQEANDLKAVFGIIKIYQLKMKLKMFHIASSKPFFLGAFVMVGE